MLMKSVTMSGKSNVDDLAALLVDTGRQFNMSAINELFISMQMQYNSHVLFMFQCSSSRLPFQYASCTARQIRVYRQVLLMSLVVVVYFPESLKLGSPYTDPLVAFGDYFEWVLCKPDAIFLLPCQQHQSTRVGIEF